MQQNKITDLNINIVKGLLSNIGNFSDTEVILFIEHAIKRTFQKNEILLNEGDVCQSAFYIISGEAFQFCYDDIDEQIIDLHIENDWCLNHSSFVTQKPSMVIIKAYSGLTVLELSITSVHELVALSPSFFQLGSVLQQTVSRVQYFDNINYLLTFIKRCFHILPQSLLFKKIQMEKQFKKASGISLLTGAILATITMAIHPVGGSLAEIAARKGVFIFTHSLALISIPFIAFGFWGLATVLITKSKITFI